MWLAEPYMRVPLTEADVALARAALAVDAGPLSALARSVAQLASAVPTVSPATSHAARRKTVLRDADGQITGVIEEEIG